MGSDCAGLVTEGLALEMLGIEHVHSFIMDQNRDVRHLAYGKYGKTPPYFKDAIDLRYLKLPTYSHPYGLSRIHF